MGVNKEMFNKGITLLSTSAEEELSGRRLRHKVEALLKCPKCSPYMQLQQWRMIGKEMIKFMDDVADFADVAAREFDRLTSNYNERGNAKWTPEEDDLLIEYKCKDLSEFEIATFLGRSVAAINNRLSYLVGTKRIRQDVNGKFYGTVNGIEYVGERITGVIEK